jgi:hypothetical protein
MRKRGFFTNLYSSIEEQCVSVREILVYLPVSLRVYCAGGVSINFGDIKGTSIIICII